MKNYYILDQEFNAKLLKLGIKRKFIANITNPDYGGFSRNANVQERLDNYCRHHICAAPKAGFQSFITGAFMWGETPEGYDFWYNIAFK